MTSLHPNIDREKALNSHLIIIGAHDSSGGAGFTSDLKAVNAFRCQSKYVVTHVTAQTHNSVLDIFPASIESFEAQLTSARPKKRSGDSVHVVIKLGMVGKIWMFKKILSFIESLEEEKHSLSLIVDPILLSSSAKSLMEEGSLDFLKMFIFPKVKLLTPNLIEAESILKLKVQNLKDIEEMGQKFLSMGVESVLIKGGHFFERLSKNSKGLKDSVNDYFCSSKRRYWVKAKEIKLNNQSNPKIRGTGCFLATAIASGMTQGLDLSDSIVMGRCLLNSSIRKSTLCGGVSILGPTCIESFDSNDFPIIEGFSNQEPYEEKSPSVKSRFKPLSDRPESFPWLYPIVDRANWISRLAETRLNIIQLRIKDLEGNALEREIEEAVYLSKKNNIRLFVNDYWKLALKHKAYGVHLGQEDLNFADLEKIRKEGLALGLSSHSYFEGAIAKGILPSYVALGPIYFTKLKAMNFSPQGVSALRTWKKIYDCPVVAIGGINLSLLPEVMEASPEIVSVVRDITLSEKPTQRVFEWQNKLSHNSI